MNDERCPTSGHDGSTYNDHFPRHRAPALLQSHGSGVGITSQNGGMVIQAAPLAFSFILQAQRRCFQAPEI